MVVGGGAAGVYGAIRAKTLAPNLNVVVIEKGKPLSKVSLFSQVFFFFFARQESEIIKPSWFIIHLLLAGKNFWRRPMQCDKWALC